MSSEKAKKIIRYVQAAVFIGLYIFFWCNREYYLQQSVSDSVAKAGFVMSRIIVVTLICGGGVALSLWEQRFSERVNKWTTFILFGFTPLVSFFALEYTNIFQSRILLKVLTEIGKKRSLLTVVILGILMLGVYVVSSSMKVAAVGLAIFVCIFGVGCYFVYAFRGIPFLASDLTIMGTAFNVMANYEYHLAFQPYVLILITITWCVALWKMKKIKGFHWKLRIPIIICYLAILGISVQTLVYTNFLKKRAHVSINTFMPQKSYGKHGATLTVLRSIQYIMVEKPEDYSFKEVEALAKTYQQDQASDTVSPNVIVIMDEAFADLKLIKDFETNQEVTPFFDNLKENTVRGKMYVSVFGGQTANTEFEVLTGNSKAFLPASSTPYQLFIKKEFPSLSHTLKNQGYQGNIAMHPYRPRGYNRQTVYPLLGFDEFLSVDDFQNSKLVRNFVSDEAQFERIIEEYQAAKQKSTAPFYTFNVTMQNHSGYDADFDNLPKDIKITDSAYESDQAERYLNLIHLSDQALEKLVDYFKAQDDPTVIVFFGDHQPGIQEAFYRKLFGKPSSQLTDVELMDKYQIPYIIWANYDIEEKENVTISANYLSSLMLESTKMKTTGYSRFLMETAKEIPVVTVFGYFGADGNFYKLEDKTSPYYEKIKDYQMLQYNNMFDSGKRLENFYD